MNSLPVFALLWPPVFAVSWGAMFYAFGCSRDRVLREGAEGWMIGAGGVIIGCIWTWNWLVLGIGAAHLALGIWMRWRRRKGRDPAASLIGEKTRALRDALVRRAREAARPRPVLKPGLGGAG